jgi:uncharacterized protein (TIGR03663 family)
MKKKRLFIVAAVLILLVAASLRFFVLERKALHHDESVNYAFADKLADRFFYKYNPNAYHGPFLYFAALPAYWTLGASKFSLRVTPALFGLLAVFFLLLMHKTIGGKGALAAALALALSPADIYYSRTFIHEIYLASFHAGMIWALLAYVQERKILHLLAFSAFVALCFSVKETTAISLVALLGAYLGTRFFAWGMPDSEEPSGRFRIDWGILWKQKIFVADGIAIAVSILLIFYTSFLTYPHGILRFFEAYMPWLTTGFGEKAHAKPFYYFFEIVAKYYGPVAIPGLLTGLWALAKKDVKGVFLFLYAMLTLIAYSAIPYKTPWCAIQVGLPFLVLGGYGISRTLDPLRVPAAWRANVIGFLVIAFIPYLYSSVGINFYEYDKDKYKIVYVQTDRTYEDMFDLLDTMAKRSGLGEGMPIAMIKAKNPGRFYIRNYTNVKRYTETPTTVIEQPVVLIDSDLLESIRDSLLGDYATLTFPVWPGTYVALLIEQSFYDNYAKESS